MALTNYQGDSFQDLFHYPVSSVRPGYLIEHELGVGPTRAAELLNNWLTGGAPKPLDPSQIYGEQSALSGVYARAAAGQGVAGLFGFGKTIGSMAPLASGVPYSVPAAPKFSLNPLFNPAYGGVKPPGGRG